MTWELKLGASALTPPRTAGQPVGARWREAYAVRLWMTDALILVWVVYGTQIAWLGLQPPRVSGLAEIDYWIFSGVLIGAWIWMLGLLETRSDKVIGAGITEYIRVGDASLRVFGAVAIVAFLFRVDVARGYLILALPMGIVTLVLGRWLWRQWLIAHRRMGLYTARVLLVGCEESVAQIARELSRTTDAGYTVVGACVPAAVGGTVAGTGIPIVGDLESVPAALARIDADTVAITGTDDLPPDRVKQISWALESGGQHLVLAPSIVDISGPRIRTRPVAGLPLIHVERPSLSRGQRVAKRLADIVCSAAMLVVLAPALLLIAAAVRATSPGPALFRQARIGRNGEPFHILKFRTMYEGADAELATLLAAQGTDDRPLFKVRDDPRVTPLGRFLRKYSIDEFPQLLNVLSGSMSLVGPRPQVHAEVALYSDAAKRRLLIRPGMTGPWQVSGRSSLDWEEAMRLDLSYVENWSLLGDAAILVKTVKAVVSPGGTAV